MADEIGGLLDLEDRLSKWIEMEGKGQTHCLAVVCAYLARTLNFDLRALMTAIEAEATRLRQAKDKGYAMGPLNDLAAFLRDGQRPAPAP